MGVRLILYTCLGIQTRSKGDNQQDMPTKKGLPNEFGSPHFFILYHSRIAISRRKMYQNIMATDAKSANAAATCLSCG